MYLQLMCLEDRTLLDFESFLSRYNFFIFFYFACILLCDMTTVPQILGKLESESKCKVLILFCGFIDLFVYKEMSQLITNKQTNAHTTQQKEKLMVLRAVSGIKFPFLLSH